MSELKNFFKQVLEMPHEIVKEFIFNRKKYVKIDFFRETVFWSVEEWIDGKFTSTDKYVMTNLRLMNQEFGENYWFREFDVAECSNVEIAQATKGS